ncbi:glycosyltransferase family 2 protein, partial [bacterium]|nr:glycosyltransferase family 2 protein [bacterium]
MTDIKNHDQTLSIVIPCYNEGKNIPLIVERLSSLLKDRRDVQVVLVDNGSNDLSFSNIDQLIEGKACFTVCRVENNQGYGFGILSGLKSATGTVLSWTHADLQTDPQDVLHAFDLYLRSLQAHPQMIIKGERRNRKAMEKLFTFGMQLIASSALRAPLSDINAQPKLFSRRFYQDFLIKEAPWDFSLD